MRSLICALIALVAFTSCSDSHDKVMGDSLTVMEKVNAALAKVTSPETAKAAGETLKQLAEEMKAIQERSKKLGKPAGELVTQLEKEYGPRMQKAMNDMMANMGKLMEHPELAAAIGEVQGSMPK